jgi:TonB-dependent starch-binding outer membrane protein SusC
MNQRLYTLPKKLGVVLLFLLFAGLSSLSAQRTVSGKVSDAAGPIPGASVLIKGTTTGSATDGDGNFSFSVKGDNLTLVVSAVGYSTQEIALGAESTINVTLTEDVSTLGEVVVTGYTVDTKRNTTGSVSTIKPKDLTAIPTGNIEQQLQGRASGVTVITNGQPGTNSIVRIRGFGSFLSNEPLYIVDGVPTTSTDFLAPDDIESVTVLKDAAAASIYGARAASGVIVYTTRRGKKGDKKVTVNYDGLYGITDPGKSPSMLNPQEAADWTWQALKNTATADGKAFTPNHPQYGSGQTPVLPNWLIVGANSGAAITGTVDLAAEKLKYNNDQAKGALYLVTPANKEGTDWYKAITRTAPMQRHNLGFSGASDNARYYVGFGMQDQAGIVLNNSFKRYDFRANSEFDVMKGFRIGQNLQFTYRSVLGQQGNNNGAGIAETESDILAAIRMPTIIPVYDAFGGYGGTQAKGFNNPRNPVAIRDRLADNRAFNIGGFGNVYAELDLIPGLTFRTSLGGNYGNSYSTNYTKISYENSENFTSFQFSEASSYFYSWINTNTLRYNQKFGVHGIEAIAGIEALNTGKSRFVSGSGQNPYLKDVNFITLGTATSSQSTTSGLNLGVNFYSQFGRAKYTYNDKYYLEGVLRRDGSSRFGANSRFGIFPAVSAGWRISGEDFMKSLDMVSDMKLRAGWGQMGNSNAVNPTNQFTLFSNTLAGGSYPITGSNTSASSGFFQSQVGNPDAKWETSTTTNIGLDLSLFKDKLEILVDLWTRKTTDLLYQVPLPIVGGLATAPFQNIASMTNTGLDFQVTNRGKIKGDWSYDATLVASFLTNKIDKLAENITYFDTRPPTNRLSGPPIRNLAGAPLSSFFGYQVTGLFQNAAEVAAAPAQEGKGVGRFRYADLDGDGKITPTDRTTIGNPVPKFTGGLTLGVNYKDFSLSTYLYTSLGNEIFNMSKWYTDFYASFTGSALSSRVKDSWSPTNTGATIPIFESASNSSTNIEPNSYYVEDGSYLRMQNLSLSYNVPNKFTGGIFKKLKVYASVNNLFTLTKYSGLDPGVGGAVDTAFGIDIGNYPITRSILFGVNAAF